MKGRPEPRHIRSRTALEPDCAGMCRQLSIKPVPIIVSAALWAVRVIMLTSSQTCAGMCRLLQRLGRAAITSRTYRGVPLERVIQNLQGPPLGRNFLCLRASMFLIK